MRDGLISQSLMVNQDRRCLIPRLEYGMADTVRGLPSGLFICQDVARRRGIKEGLLLAMK